MLKSVALSSIAWVFLIFCWWLLTARIPTPIVDPLFLASPRATFAALRSGFFQPLGLGWDLVYTLLRALGGFCIASILGVPLGLLLGGNSLARRLLSSLIDGLRSMPATALFPVFLLAFGGGEASKVAVAIFVCLWAMVIYTASGVMITGETRRFLLRQHKVTRSQFFLDGLLYPALPNILGGMRATLSLAFVITIGVEMLVGTKLGLGHSIYVAQTTYQIPTMYAAVVLAAIAGIILNRLLLLLIPLVVRWEAPQR